MCKQMVYKRQISVFFKTFWSIIKQKESVKMENLTWDLSKLYKGYDDPKYQDDYNELCNLIGEANSFINEEKGKALDVVTRFLQLEERITVIMGPLFSFSNLQIATDVNNRQAIGEMMKVRMKLQELVSFSVFMDKYIKDVDVEELINVSDFCKQYAFYLRKMKKNASHSLSDKEEMLYSKMSMVASSSWSNLQSKLTSNLSIKVPGFSEEMPLSAVRNLASSTDPVVRKNAYEAELKAYESISEAVAMGLNNIKREVNIMAPLRGYKDAIEMTLEASNMQRETLDALIGAIKDELPNFRRYFKLKAKALGYTNGLPFYELFAPMGDGNKTYSYEEAQKLVLDAYSSFSDSLRAMAERAFKERWIDVLPHAGKRGGAFCSNQQTIKESRVMTNFTGSLSDVQTIAHELGHAYHGQVISDNAPLNWHYPMPLAETASIFCQTLMSKKMIEEAEDKALKLSLVEISLQEDTQCIVDILSRFLFESMVVDCPIEKPLDSKMMCDFMLRAQDESYGDGLDPNYRHPYMWLCKSHYYSAGLNFYNFPYAFGTLYGKGLYKQYLKNKDEFVKRYDEMLMNTTKMSIEDVAKTMGIDVTKKAFWLESLKFIEEEIDLYEVLLHE